MTETTTRHPIRARCRTSEFVPVLPTDFELGAGHPIDPPAVIADARISLYCIDPELAYALFVETSEPLLPAAHTFYYASQYRLARAAIRMPLSEFQRIAASMRVPDTSLVFLHSTGRCGSTLVSKALAALPNVASYSEPDALTRITHHRTAARTSDPWLRELCASAVRWQCKEAIGRDVTLVLKFRSQVVELCDLLFGAFPQAKTVFLYRNALTWLTSFLGSLQAGIEFTDAENRRWEDALSLCHPLLHEYHDPSRPMSPAKLWTLEWVSSVERFLDLQALGADAFVLRYDTLRARPEACIEGLLRHLELSVADRAPIDAVLSRDSQAGTGASRLEKAEQPLHATYRDEAIALLATRPRLRHADFLVPGTFEPTETQRADRSD